MFAVTPKKLVHWALDASLSDLASPFSEAPSSQSCSSTSSLQYVNSQLIAHGFVHDEGLSLEGLGKQDVDRVVKCLLGMLSQRVDDMSRTEDLTTKLRTLSYDHERLTSMHKTQTEKAANAEREMNLHKTRMTAATKTLQSSENAHKHTTAELQRTRTTLHALRSTHYTEIKKLEKEKERMVERWSKLSDSQLRVNGLQSGLSCANLHVVEASDVQLYGKGTGFLDVALEQAETARAELFKQNRRLKGLLLSTVNELQSVLHSARPASQPDIVPEPTPITSTTLFAGGPVESAGETFNSLFTTLRSTISRSCDPTPTPCTHKNVSPPENPSPSESAEVERLQAIVEKLRADLAEAQKQASVSAAQTQELFDRFAEEQRVGSGAADMSVDLITAPARDEERQRLDARFKELEDERQKFTEAAIRLGKEKAAIEAERLKLLEEKRSWEVEQMLAELPPTPAPGAGPSCSPRPFVAPVVQPLVIARRSPRLSARKLKGKVASPRKTRVSRRSSGLGAAVPTPKAKRKVLPSYETEVLPSTVPASSVPPSPVRPLPTFKTSMAAPSVPSPIQLTGAFVLPPPSPAASFPSLLDGKSSFPPPLPPLPKLEIPPPSDEVSDDSMDVTPETLPTSTSTSTSSISSAPSTSSASSTSSTSTQSRPSTSAPPVPSTPSARPFPMAKPFAQRMIHAYSPAKPSPLSRILMLGASPDSPEGGPALGALTETDESSLDVSFPAPLRRPPSPLHTQPLQTARSLAEELGVSMDDEDERPLRARQPEPKAAPAAKDPKGKGKAPSAPAPAQTKPNSRTRAGAALEKENVKRAKLSAPAPGSAGSAKSSGSASSSSGSSSRETKRAAAAGKPPPRTRSGAAGAQGRTAPPKGGARRVPAGSAQAASVPTWRG